MSVYLRDLDGTGSMHVCAKGDPGAVEYVPVWQPIETAPKNGTAVDVWCDDPDGGFRIADAFYGIPYHECISQYCDSCPPDRTVKKWREPLGNSPIKPKFWMPITRPAAVTSPDRGGEG